MDYTPVNEEYAYRMQSIDTIFDLHYKLWDWIYNEIIRHHNLNKPVTGINPLKNKYFKVHNINKIPDQYCYLCSKFECYECPLKILLETKNGIFYTPMDSCVEIYDELVKYIYYNNLISAANCAKKIRDIYFEKDQYKKIMEIDSPKKEIACTSSTISKYFDDVMSFEQGEDRWLKKNPIEN